MLPLPPTGLDSMEQNLAEGFTVLRLDGQLIDTAQQFFSWMAKVQESMSEDEEHKYRLVRDGLQALQDECEHLLEAVDAALSELTMLEKNFLFVSSKTGALQRACEELLQQQTRLMLLADGIQQKLSYFNELEMISTRFNSPTLSVNNEGFIPMLAKLDDCISYITAHPEFHDFPVYMHRVELCVTRVTQLLKTHITRQLLSLTASLSRQQSGVPGNDNAFTMFYVRFRTTAPKVQNLIEQIEQRTDQGSEYLACLANVHACYLDQRQRLLEPSVTSTIAELANANHRDHCALVRGGCAFLVHVCQDEHRLFREFFSRPSPKLDEMLEKLCLTIYEVLRPIVIHLAHLETLSELCSILKNEMLEAHVLNNPDQLAAFATVVKQVLEDVQERLVYRTHIYIRTEILGYRPAPGDLAYPDKLEMMEKIAESLREEEKQRHVRPQEGSFLDVKLEDLSANAGPPTWIPAPVSPAVLHAMWYPTARRTLVCLSKLYRCTEKPVFQGLSQEALAACMQSLLAASDAISKNKTSTDGQLFLIKHLLILREQIAAFHADFTIREISVDLKKTKDAAFKMLTPKYVGKLFRLNSNNALLEFILQGSPEIKEQCVDSKKDVDFELKAVCERFIEQQRRVLLEGIQNFMDKVSSLKNTDSKGQPSSSLSQQPWGKPEQIQDVVASTYKTLKQKLPAILHSLSLYLNNRDTERILFKPIKSHVQAAFLKLHTTLADEFGPEDLQIIACPSPEQVNLLLSMEK
uniref:conserved oligomeric Golgi complex subunit 3 isoform X1 n=2 Tax=Myxine glutinosa TaxID=7769 RepID=UPI00358FB4A7